MQACDGLHWPEALVLSPVKIQYSRECQKVGCSCPRETEYARPSNDASACFGLHNLYYQLGKMWCVFNDTAIELEIDSRCLISSLCKWSAALPAEHFVNP
eukprot:1137034-Pelagomonas_calceolata.AAC.3